MPPKRRPQRSTGRKPNPVVKTPESQSDTGLAPSSQTLSPPDDKAVDNVFLSETLASPDKEQSLTVVNGGEVPLIANCTTVGDDKNGGSNVGKPKKVVKKTIKVMKKVIKKVPKKVVKQGFDSKSGEAGKGCGNAELANSTTISAGIDEEVFKCGTTIIDQLNSEILVNKAEADEKNDVLEEVEGERIIEIKGSECMVVDHILSKNEGVVEEGNGYSGKEGEGEKEAEGKKDAGRDREYGKEDGELCRGGNGKEEREGAEEVGEGKLFKGELGAMERKKRRKREVFIGRLDKDVKEEDIRKVFKEAGDIVDLRVLMNSKTEKKFAFVRYASAEDAQRALQKFAKVEICGKESGATPVEGNDTIFLGNIDKKWKDEDVVQLLKKIGIGKIDKVTVMVDPTNTKCNRGFAFVEFETINDAQVAYMKLQEKDVFRKNQKLKVAWAEPLKELDEEEMLKVKTVYAEFIPSSWDEEKVRDTFVKFGEIDDIVLARNLRTSKRKDFAFISYKTRLAAIKCIESFDLDLRDEDGTKVNVKVSLAKPKSKSKKLPVAKPFGTEIPKGIPKTRHTKDRPSEPQIRTQPSVPHYGIQIPMASSTNVELVQLLREQASWRPTHASLSNSPMGIHYSNPLSGRKRQFTVLETDRLHEDLNNYRRLRLDDSYSVAGSSHSLVHPSGLTNPMAYHQRHSGYPSAGTAYGARNYASNVEIQDISLDRSFSYLRYPG
ncbi:putative RNA-binding protein 46 [Bienertia sinuspersici]